MHCNVKAFCMEILAFFVYSLRQNIGFGIWNLNFLLSSMTKKIFDLGQISQPSWSWVVSSLKSLRVDLDKLWGCFVLLHSGIPYAQTQWGLWLRFVAHYHATHFLTSYLNVMACSGHSDCAGNLKSVKAVPRWGESTWHERLHTFCKELESVSTLPCHQSPFLIPESSTPLPLSASISLQLLHITLLACAWKCPCNWTCESTVTTEQENNLVSSFLISRSKEWSPVARLLDPNCPFYCFTKTHHFVQFIYWLFHLKRKFLPR